MKIMKKCKKSLNFLTLVIKNHFTSNDFNAHRFMRSLKKYTNVTSDDFNTFWIHME